MNKAEKKEFIKSLCNSVRDDLLKKVDIMPECWDGLELRLLLAAKFERESRFDISRKRKSAFQNEVAVKNI
jgi:hypothetical protein